MLGILLSITWGLLTAAPSDFEGKLIAAVRFQPETQPLAASEINRIVNSIVGRALTPALTSQTIETLYRTGRYEEIALDAALDNGQVVLTILTRQNWFISRISVEGGTEPPNREQLIGASKLELGGQYTEERMTEAIRGVRDLLRANGFQTPRVQPLVERFPENDEVQVQFLVDAGPRAYFTRPIIKGNLQLTEGQILNATGWKRWWGLFGWKELSEARLQRGLDRVRRAYLSKDFLLAKVELKAAEYLPLDNVVRPELGIDAGPKVRIAATGAKISGGQLKGLIPIYQEHSIDQDLLVEGARKVTQHFQAKGYFDTRVTYDRKILDKEQAIEYAIERGPQFKLVNVTISGNQYFDALTIRERMAIEPAGRVIRRSGSFSEDMLSRDAGAIGELYRSNGFRDVEVKTRVERNYAGKEREVGVFIDIVEGGQWFVNRLDISGIDLQLYEHIRSTLTSTEGQPYSAFNVAADRDNILNFYYDNGYPDASMDIAATQAESPRMMNVKYVVTEGRRQYVRDVEPQGLVTTRPSLVASRISLREGEPLSLSRMVFSQRRLYDLGIFAKVDTALVNPTGNTREKRVLFQMEEASRYSFNIGVGAEFGRFGGNPASLNSPAGGAAFSPRISLGVSRLNLFGVGHTAGVQTRLSTLQKRGLITYLAPQFQGRENFNLTVTALFDDSRNVQTFRSQRIEGALQFAQRFSRASSAQYRYVFRRVLVFDQKIDPTLICRLCQQGRVGLMGATFIHDRRDDPSNATRGLYYSLDFSMASKVFGSEPSFARLLARNSSYHRAGKNLSLSRNTTFGVMENFGAGEIPIYELFFAGGAVSHRAFPENQAGPRDLITGFPSGGRALLFNQTELRFPFIGENLGAVIFHDAGNVYTKLDDVSVRFRQRPPVDGVYTDFSYMVHAVGMGVRYRTPIGPVRLDFAYGMNSPRFVGCRGSVDEISKCTADTRVPQRVSRFQFHVSLGQAF